MNAVSYASKARLELARRELARRSILHFTKYTMPEFQETSFHRNYARFLDLFAQKKIMKGMITCPPQHGKSELSSRRLPSFILGKRPNSKIAILSYAASFAQGFNRDNQRIIDSPEYKNLFPETFLNSNNIRTVSSQYQRNSTIFEIVGKRGFLKTVGRGGPLTGDPVDVAIMDDLYKDSAEGNSPVIRDAVIEWYTSVVMKRLHNDSQQLIVFTRWHDEDLIGWLEERDTVIVVESWDQLETIDPNAWYKINFPALMNHPKTELDQREMGEPLYPEKHSKEKLEKERSIDPEKFEAMNQGDPTPKAGLLVTQPFNTYDVRPSNFTKLGNYTDVADTGTDYLCSINYGVYQDRIYILDVYYTQDPQEITEGATADLLKRGMIREAMFESNNGGRGFARAVDRILKQKIVITWFHQSLNKESRILTNAVSVQNSLLFPKNWQSRWPEFSKHILRFKKKFRANKHDDGWDALTGVYEFSGLNSSISALYRM
jgi:predicted phage terminase large subunit-like protein